MRILMAVGTQGERYLESRLLTRWHVALGALYPLMRTHQSKPRACVVGYRKCRWPPAGYGVACLASAVVRAALKLPCVRIGPVTAGACSVRNGRFEVRSRMATRAWHFKVLAQQWIVRSRVIEGGDER
jgi:hypothetical protein